MVKEALLEKFTGKNLVFRVPALDNPDKSYKFRYLFENCDLVLEKGSDIWSNIDDAKHFKLETVL
jgi:hypothetical protein